MAIEKELKPSKILNRQIYKIKITIINLKTKNHEQKTVFNVIINSHNVVISSSMYVSNIESKWKTIIK